MAEKKNQKKTTLANRAVQAEHTKRINEYIKKINLNIQRNA